MNVGTFGSFTAARLGMYAAQKGLSVTGNNIANINTLGYTRQALDQVSLKVGSNDRYQSKNNVRVGSGVLCTGISQLRDPYLDIRYRTEMANVGAMDSKLSGLDQIASILDEVAKNDGDGILEKQLTDIMSALQDLSASAGQNDLDGIVRSEASTLAKLLNSYAKQLQEVKDGTVSTLRKDIDRVNSILTSIRDLNSSIRQSEIHGDNALEMRDSRNLLIDELSQYIKIDVTYTNEDIGEGQMVEKLVIKMANANPDPTITTDSSTLIDGIYATQLLTPEANKDYDPTRPDATNQADRKYFKYLDGAGNGTNDPTQSSGYNRDFDPDLPFDPSDPNCYRYLKADGSGTNDPTESRGYNQNFNPTPDPNTEPMFFRYLDINGKPTNDPSKAKQEFNNNFDIMLAPLKTIAGTTLTTPKIDDKPASKQDYDSFWNVENIIDDGMGTKTEIKFIEKKTDIPASVKANDPPTTPSAVLDNLKIFKKTLANYAGSGTPPLVANNGAVTIAYNTADKLFELRIGSTVVGKSETLEFPANGSGLESKKTITFTADDGTDLGSFTLKKDTLASAFDNPAATGLTYTPSDTKIDYFKRTITTTYSAPISLADNDLYGSLQSTRELLTEKGEFASSQDIQRDQNATVKRGFTYYQNMLDDLAVQIATQFNTANTGYMVDQNGNYLDSAGNILKLPLTDTTTTTPTTTDITFQKGKTLSADQKSALIKNGHYLKDSNGFLLDEDGQQILDDTTNLPVKFDDAPDKAIADFDGYLTAEGEKMGGALFSNHSSGNDTTGITAANISVSNGWSEGQWRIVNSFIKPTFTTDDTTGTDGTTPPDPDADSGTDQNIPSQANDNILHMVALFTTKLDYTVTKDKLDENGVDIGDVTSTYFHGTFQEMLANMTGTLADDINDTSTMLDTHYASAVSLDTSRDSVSSVDLNDEAMGMMQYQKSYSAACRLMTTLDETLDKLINGTGVVGR